MLHNPIAMDFTDTRGCSCPHQRSRRTSLLSFSLLVCYLTIDDNIHDICAYTIVCCSICGTLQHLSLCVGLLLCIQRCMHAHMQPLSIPIWVGADHHLGVADMLTTCCLTQSLLDVPRIVVADCGCWLVQFPRIAAPPPGMLAVWPLYLLKNWMHWELTGRYIAFAEYNR